MISVVIPTYNRQHTLARALDSVYAQTFQPAEVIVVDDGSNDGSEQRVRQSYPHVNYIRQANRGVSAARNRGISISAQPWIALLDSDDAWLPEKLAKQMQHVKDKVGVKLVHCDEIWIRDGVRVNPKLKHQKQGGWIFPHCLPLCCISPSAAMIHRSVFDEIGVFDEHLPACEDYDLWLRLCARYPVEYVAEPLLVKYGGHEDQLSRKYWGMDRFRIEALRKILDENVLCSDNMQLAVDMLAKKISVYLAGARKREKKDEVEYYLALQQKYIHQGQS